MRHIKPANDHIKKTFDINDTRIFIIVANQLIDKSMNNFSSNPAWNFI